MKISIKQLAFLLAFNLWVAPFFAQTNIKGKVINNAAASVNGCNVLLLAKTDSALVKGTLTNNAGEYEFNNVAMGSYLLNYSFVGYENLLKPVDINASSPSVLNIEPQTIIPSAIQLAEATVIAKKPLFEQKIDRLVVNVKNSITNAGGTVLDVLQKSPGVFVDRQNATIIMSGKSGVRVMINGKMNYMPAEALVAMLGGMPAATVEKIELITTPPAKYDAEGNAGYINIVLSQSPDAGFSGSYSLTMAAWNGTFPAAAFNFNYRKKKINFYGNTAASRLAQNQLFSNYRSILYNGKTTESFSASHRDPSQFNSNILLGLDIQASKNTIVGILASGYWNKWDMQAKNLSSFFINGKKDTSLKIDNSEINRWENATVNFNIQQKLSGSSSITFNIDYLKYLNLNPTNYANNYYDASNVFIKTVNTKSSKETDIEIFPLQLDYAKTWNEKIDLEAGAKLVYSKFTNNVEVGEWQTNHWQYDPEFTGTFHLKENIAALYATANYTVNKKNSIKAGLRYEHTYSNLGSQIKENIVNRKYGYLFPSIFWSHSINDKNKINFSYSKRINRPSFNNLAPFLIFFDPNTFVSGNIALQPSLTDAIKADYIFKQFVFSIGYNYDKYSIGQFQAQINAASNKLYLTAQNLKYLQTIVATVVLPITVKPWWSMYVNITGQNQKALADFTGKPITVSVFNYSISGAQNFTLPQKWDIEVSGFYNSKSVIGVYVMQPLGSLSIGIAKKLRNSSLKFVADNIFSTMKLNWINDVPKEHFYYSGSFLLSSRIFKLTYTKNFGNKILKQKRDRNTASDDVKSRVTN